MQPDDDNAREIELALHEDDEPEEIDPMSPEERRIINEEAKAEEEFIADQEDSVNPMFFEKTEDEKKEENQPNAAAEQQLDGAFGSGGLIEEEPADPISNEEELRKEGADIDYTQADITPAIEPVGELPEETQPIADPNPAPAPEAMAPMATDVATPTGEVVSVTPKPIPAGMPTSSEPVPTEPKDNTDEKKDSKPKKKKTALVAVIVAVLLLAIGGGLGFYAYSQHESPTRIVNDAVDGLLDSSVLGTTANSVIASGKHPMIDATVRDSRYSAGESVHVSIAFKDSAIIYLKLSNLKLVLDKLKSEEQKTTEEEKTWPQKSDIYNELFNNIEDKWVSLSTANLDSSQKDEKKYKCVIESLDTFIGSSFKKKAAGIYRSNAFLDYDENTQIVDENGIKQYPVTFSDGDFDKYQKAIRETDEYAGFEACFVVQDEDEDEEEENEAEKEESASVKVKYSAKFGISGWSHTLQTMDIVKKTTISDDDGETTGEVNTKVKYDSVSDGELENAKKLKDVLDEVKKSLEIAKDSYVKNASSEKCKQNNNESLDQCLVQAAKSIEEEIELDSIDFADLIFDSLNK